ncbi:tellurite resistance TerB family protein [Rhizobium leguminosarum]|uniref:tellurite resistance TerB family protein n=1 Tax=Rhizobium leguminosarum TaxID=384 RepID=UPI00102FDEFF|nr:tellurite resistance TerB family protein [Rhizobium leguminosarum]QIO74102.1 tellurite resistance TerB family protein [Rhizobium leguminosarum bv. trifolii]QIO81121.1 tellurite resistance TerB family protein [Rhizobium leguminosarum bv. trifolii]TAU22383.1 tellurite resistance TerB family protein [Rhizobium leguminosarum]TAU42380.1 tellurite resistance TerB family protein [Rhizobium leguminosarum]TAY39058.1 tellurite resistance TerB family protein [Rhizobium leguminosarum]
MFDAKKLLDQFLGSQMPGLGGSVRDRAGDAVQTAKNNPLATGAIAAVLLGTKTGRGIAGNALAIGGLAAIAGLGYQAYKNYQAGQAPAAPSDAPSANNPVLLPPPAESGFGPASPAGSNEFVLVLIRAMIAAAKADGHIDDAERALIMDKVKAADVTGEAAAFIEQELASPTDIDALVAAATTEEQRVELYTASRLTIDPDSRAERGYLDLLAGRLGLADQLVDHIEATVSSAKVTLSQ